MAAAEDTDKLTERDPMNRKKCIAALVMSAAVLCGCDGSGKAGGNEIPVFYGDTGASFTTAAAERYDVEEYTTIGASVEYLYAQTLTVPYDTNVTEYNVRRGDKLSAGDVIAAFDHSDFDYEYQNQKIRADSAYSRWQSSGSELLRLEYEQEAKKLELIQYRIDLCTIKAPYDCIITAVEPMKAGEAVEAGKKICSIAKPDEVYVTVKEQKDLFAFGMPVQLKFGTSSTFSGTVVMVPDGTRGGINSVVIALDDGERERADAEAGSIVSAGWGSVIVTDYRDYNVLCVPEKSVMTYSGETYCYIEDNGERVRVPVEAGKTVNGLTVVLSGLSDGDVVSY